LLGPIGFLVDGLLSEFVFYALLVALISIVPKQGMCALVIAIRFLLGGLLLGMITPVGAIHGAVSAVALELAVWLSGITRAGAKYDLSKGHFRLRVAVLFALANALVSWIGFQLSIVLFRLHYAEWYVFLSVAIGGFLYCMLGAFAGRAIGRRLSHVQV
jgi:hypothetical protein